jgi:hypothetical protein
VQTADIHAMILLGLGLVCADLSASNLGKYFGSREYFLLFPAVFR